MAAIRVGIGGWTFEPWRGLFYPDGLRHADELPYAAERLTSIEINGTFYRTQTPKTFRSWHDSVPADFVFAVKAHRAAAQRTEPEWMTSRSAIRPPRSTVGPSGWPRSPSLTGARCSAT